MERSADDSRGYSECASFATNPAAIQSTPALPDAGCDFSAFVVDRKGHFLFL
jgi:hypothetical protein